MLRRVITGLAVLASSFLGACEDAPVSTVLYSSGQASTYLDYVASRGALLVEPLNNPFSVGQTWFSETLAGMVRTSISYRTLSTTGDERRAMETKFRLRFVFDPPDGYDPRQMCLGVAPAEHQTSDRLVVLAVFCNGSEMEAAVRGSVIYPNQPSDKQFEALINQMIRQMFAPPSPGGP